MNNLNYDRLYKAILQNFPNDLVFKPDCCENCLYFVGRTFSGIYTHCTVHAYERPEEHCPDFKREDNQEDNSTQ